jgi:hypothetical protein
LAFTTTHFFPEERVKMCILTSKETSFVEEKSKFVCIIISQTSFLLGKKRHILTRFSGKKYAVVNA